MLSMFGIAIKRAKEDSVSDFEITDDATNESPTSNTSRYNFALSPGLKLELDPGDSLDTIESKTPASETIRYFELMIQIICLALDIPISFFDSRKSSYSSARQDLLQYIESAKNKRQENLDYILNPITAWKVNTWANTIDIETGNPILELPSGLLARDIKWEWIPVGIPWIDPLKEINADAMAISQGLKSRQLVSTERGLDWWNILDQLESEEQEIIKRGVTVQIGMPGAVTTRDEETENPANKPTEEK